MNTVAHSTMSAASDGLSRSEVLGQNPRPPGSAYQEKGFYAVLWRDLVKKGHWYGEVWHRRKNGEIYAEMQAISAVRDASGRIQHYVALFSDITLLKAHERQLDHLANCDALSARSNRVLLADRMHQTMAQARRRGQRLAMAHRNLGYMKSINERHVYTAADQSLMTVANRMQQALREGDPLARFGDNEFVAVLLDLTDAASGVPLLTRLLAAAVRPVHAGDLVLQVSASLGVTFYPQAEDVEADQFLLQVDQPMFKDSPAGKPEREVRVRQESLECIHRAFVAGEFVLHYQPRVNMRSGKVIGAEARIHWQHPKKGLLPPAAFLPVIEDDPLAIELGEWVIDTALAQVDAWREAGVSIPVSVNVGARQLQQVDFARRLREILALHPGVRPGDLGLGLQEPGVPADLPGVSRVIKSCREIGVSCALNDFGTGDSSLTCLKRLPVTQLKTKPCLVRDMLDGPHGLAVIENVLGMSRAFRRQFIAEGVNTVEHGAALLHLGCELAQGNIIALPMPAADLPAWASDWRPDPAWVNLPAVVREDLPLPPESWRT
ncbi:putative bifunctional diguanylate cyclase/phosphodiesterase [Propionivibrio sp.]|uniref:putative bifunctional diguanylate cyclase/phosphodiesterase n=1 Tax=Propionivibrio sp. TaxID=2212460 RepID=UPI003BF0242E